VKLVVQWAALLVEHLVAWKGVKLVVQWAALLVALRVVHLAFLTAVPWAVGSDDVLAEPKVDSLVDLMVAWSVAVWVGMKVVVKDEMRVDQWDAWLVGCLVDETAFSWADQWGVLWAVLSAVGSVYVTAVRWAVWWAVWWAALWGGVWAGWWAVCLVCKTAANLVVWSELILVVHWVALWEDDSAVRRVYLKAVQKVASLALMWGMLVAMLADKRVAVKVALRADSSACLWEGDNKKRHQRSKSLHVEMAKLPLRWHTNDCCWGRW